VPGSEPRDPRQRIVALFTTRLPYKAAAIFFALVLWLVVSAEEPAEQLVEVRFAPVLDSSLQLVGNRPGIRALVAGPARELLKLYTTPPTVRRAFGAGTSDSIRIELRASDVSLPDGVSARVLDVQPRALQLRFRTLVERRVPVRSALRPEAGVLAANAEFVFEPESVTVRGERALVARIDAVRTEARTVSAGEPPEFVEVEVGRSGVEATPERVRVLVRTRGVVAPVLDNVVVDSLGVAADSLRPPAARPDSLARRDSVRRDSLRRDSLRRVPPETAP
jgi:hypothetical protein